MTDREMIGHLLRQNKKYFETNGKEGSHLDLSYADLRGVNLYAATMTGVDMGWADLSGVDLRDADLSGAKLNSADFTGADLSGIIIYEEEEK